MARGIPIDGIADFLEGEINEIVRETTIDLHGKLQTYKALNRNGYGTPVDSGDLIRAWQMTMDNPLQAGCLIIWCMQSQLLTAKTCLDLGWTAQAHLNTKLDKALSPVIQTQ